MYLALLLLSIGIIVTSAEPPCVCHITRGGRTANCDSKNLTEIPECVPSSVKNLLLSMNPLTINKNTFSRFTSLEHLELRKTKIAPLQEDSLYGLRNLGWLSIGWNNISSVPPKMFKNIPKLNHLDLWANSLESLPDNQFEFAPNLSNINLDYNRLVTLNSTVFSNLSHLQKLGLRKNQWHCDCQLRNLFHWVQNSGISLPDEPTCWTPQDVQGTGITAALDNLTC